MFFRIRVKGGGRIAQIYAIRQALAKALVAYYQKRESAVSVHFLLLKLFKFYLLVNSHLTCTYFFLQKFGKIEIFKPIYSK
jgi:hypothetical protein